MRLIIALVLALAFVPVLAQEDPPVPHAPLLFEATWIAPTGIAHLLYIQGSNAIATCFSKVKHGASERTPLGCYVNAQRMPGYTASDDLPMPSYVDYDSIPAAGDTYFAVEHAPDGTPMGEYTTLLPFPCYLPLIAR